MPQDIRDIGIYHAESGRIKADLHLAVDERLRGIVKASPFYVADFKFYTAPQWRGQENGFSVQTCYCFNDFDEIFGRVKITEKAIETILAPGTVNNPDCRTSTDVIKCVLSLEEQVKLDIE
jgi:hypothetical protein